MAQPQPRLAEPPSAANTAEGTTNALALLPEYLRLLITRLAAHGIGDCPGRCRCGRLCPCAEEHRVADLLDIAGSACRYPALSRHHNIPASVCVPGPARFLQDPPSQPRRIDVGR